MNEDVDKIEEFDELNIRDSIIVDNDDKEEEKTLEFNNNNNNNSNKDVIIKSKLSLFAICYIYCFYHQT